MEDDLSHVKDLKEIFEDLRPKLLSNISPKFKLKSSQEIYNKTKRDGRYTPNKNNLK